MRPMFAICLTACTLLALPACSLAQMVTLLDSLSGIRARGPGIPSSFKVAGLTLDNEGNFLFADSRNHLIRRLDRDGGLAVVAGNGIKGQGGEGGPATEANLSFPRDVAIDSQGNIYIADRGEIPCNKCHPINHRILKVDNSGIITRIATLPREDPPHHIAVDKQGGVYLSAGADFFSLYKVNSSGGLDRYLTSNGTPFGGMGVNSQGLLISASAGSFWQLDTESEKGGSTHNYPGLAGTIAVDGQDRLYTLEYSAEGAHLDQWIDSTETWLRLDLVKPWEEIGPQGSELSLEAIDDRGFFIFRRDDRIFKWKSSGPIITTVAGSGEKGFGGDGGTATEAELAYPLGIAVDPDHNLYIADQGNLRIRKISPEGIITTFAGTGENDHSGDGGPATEAALGGLLEIASDGAGNLLIYDSRSRRLRRLGPAGLIDTVAEGVPGGSLAVLNENEYYAFSYGGQTIQRLNLLEPAAVDLISVQYPICDLAVDGQGRLFYSRPLGYDDENSLWVLPLILNSDNFQEPFEELAYSFEKLAFNIPSQMLSLESFKKPCGLAFAASGDLLIADGPGSRIYQVDLETLLFKPLVGSGQYGYGGDGGPALAAALKAPHSMAVGPRGDLYISDPEDHRVRKVSFPTAVETTLTASGLDFPPTTVLREPSDLAVDAAGNLYVCDTRQNTVWKVEPGGAIATVAGTGERGSSTIRNGSLAPLAALNHPAGLAVDGRGNLYVADSGSHRVRKVGPDGLISTLVSTRPGRDLIFIAVPSPTDIAVDGRGNLYIISGNSIEKVGPDGVMVTVAGTSGRDTGDGGPATSARLSDPHGLAVDAEGNLYIADSGHHRVRKIGSDGIISTVAGRGVRGNSGNEGPATLAQIDSPSSVAIDLHGNLFIASADQVRRVDAGGIITTVAGPQGRWSAVAVDAAGTLYMANAEDRTVHRLSYLEDAEGISTKADFNRDGAVDLSDFFLFVDAFGNADPLFDLDDDGRVDLDDFFLFLEGTSPQKLF